MPFLIVEGGLAREDVTWLKKGWGILVEFDSIWNYLGNIKHLKSKSNDYINFPL